MQSKQKTFIISIVVVIAFVIGLGFLVNKPAAPSKYTDFAKALVSDGAAMYGAFWCPHCQAQEKDFGISRPDLASMGLYHECSNADQSQNQMCTDKKVESYPTWYFAKGITVTQATDPTICKPVPAGGKVDASEDPVCQQISSQFFTVYFYKDAGVSVRSDVAPTHTGDSWQFPATASTTGELKLSFLAQQIGYTLPQ
jgi:hypothetical protein